MVNVREKQSLRVSGSLAAQSQVSSHEFGIVGRSPRFPLRLLRGRASINVPQPCVWDLRVWVSGTPPFAPEVPSRPVAFMAKSTSFTAFSPGRSPTWASERAHHVFFQVDIKGFEDPCLRQCIGVSLGHADVLAGQPVVVDGHPHVAVLEVEELS
jgi:hypothetical protein